MKWSKKKNKAGRPKLTQDEKRHVIRPTVSYDTKKWLEARTDSPGRVIDRLVNDAKQNNGKGRK